MDLLARAAAWYARQRISRIGPNSVMFGCVVALLHQAGYVPGGWITVFVAFVAPITLWIVCVETCAPGE